MDYLTVDGERVDIYEPPRTIESEFEDAFREKVNEACGYFSELCVGGSGSCEGCKLSELSDLTIDFLLKLEEKRG